MPGDANHPTSIQPQRAIVVPRARRQPGAAALPLQTLVEPVFAEYQTGVIQLIAPALAGKTTALRHLAAVLRRDRALTFLDQPKHEHCLRASESALLILATQFSAPVPTRACFLSRRMDDRRLRRISRRRSSPAGEERSGSDRERWILRAPHGSARPGADRAR